MHPHLGINQLFHFEYRKPVEEVRGKMEAKVSAIKKKIEERKLRIVALRKEHNIDDTALIELLQAARRQAKAAESETTSIQYKYQVSNAAVPGKMEERMIGAGTINGLLTENDFIASEQGQVSDLEFFLRNLKPIKHYSETSGVELPDTGVSLSREALEYLGF